MYVVICINCDNSNSTDFDSLDWDKIVYGWFDTKEEAEEWVSKNCPYSYKHQIAKVNCKNFDNGNEPWNQQ